VLNDKQTKPVEFSTEGKGSQGTLNEQKSIKKFKSLEFDSSSGFICDINTGICGPVKKEEGKE